MSANPLQVTYISTVLNQEVKYVGRQRKLIGRNPSLTAEQRAFCAVQREKRINGEAYISTPLLALQFGVCERTIRHAALGVFVKHEEFVKRLVRLSAALRDKGAIQGGNNSR